MLNFIFSYVAMANVFTQVYRLVSTGKIQENDYALRCLKQWPSFFGKNAQNFDPLDVRFEGDAESVIVDANLPGFVYFAEKTLYAFYKIVNGKVITSKRNGRRIVQTMASAAHKERYGQIIVHEDVNSWKDILSNYGALPTSPYSYSTLPLSYPNELRQKLSHNIGVPVKCFSRISHDFVDGAVMGWIPNSRLFLIPVFGTIVDLQPYDIEKQEYLFDLIEEAYTHSLSTYTTKLLKIDYELVVLRDCQEFKRVQENPDIDFQRNKLPRYWFDDVNGRQEYDGESLMNTLAIERSWADNPESDIRYLVRCMFPAGAMFLRTSIEAQATTSGGGVEYIYLNNSDDRGRVGFLGSHEIKLKK